MSLLINSGAFVDFGDKNDFFSMFDFVECTKVADAVTVNRFAIVAGNEFGV